MSRLHNPAHPDETLREDVLPALTLSKVLNGKAAISPEMALRLEKWLGVENGGRADICCQSKLLLTFGKLERS